MPLDRKPSFRLEISGALARAVYAEIQRRDEAGSLHDWTPKEMLCQLARERLEQIQEER